MGARDDLVAIPDKLLRDGNIAGAVLVFMDFKDSPKRWWTGFGDLPAGGHTWQGVGDLISMSDIEAAYQVSAEAMEFQVSATPEMLALALAAKSRVRDRDVIVYLQLFATADIEIDGSTVFEGDPIGSPFALYSGTMQRMPWSAEGSTKRTITVECEGNFFRRNSPPRGNWNDADQQARYPGDRGFERLPLYAGSYETRWRS